MGGCHRGWLKKCFAHIAAYSVFNPKKQHRTLANFVCLVFLGPFPFPNAPFPSQMHQFGTLKVQCLRRRGWLATEGSNGVATE